MTNAVLNPTASDYGMIWPNAPAAVLTAFATNPGPLESAGILSSRHRLLYLVSNVEHECGGFTIKNLTENIYYTAQRMAEVWPSRFSSAAAVRARYGVAAGWQLKAFDDIYGGRMGNRPGTHDGSTFIGRAGPQVTGRDGYETVGKMIGIDLVNEPWRAAEASLQPAICAAFWSWKGLNRFADAGDFLGCVKAWNGGTNGLADRRSLMAGNDPVIQRLSIAADIASTVNEIASPAAPVEAPIVRDVEWLQNALNKLGTANPLLTVDGRYGSKTSDAVKVFQKRVGLFVDGVAGPKTKTALENALR